jgi:formate hydrogenlyase subunit 3/multisubunit Na+/H+ antiporter MnhD subunit
MEATPLLVSLGILLLWTVTALLVGGRGRLTARALGLAFALAHGGCAIWATVRVYSELATRWSGTWFSLSAAESIQLMFSVDALGATLWCALSLALVLFAYFALIGQVRGARVQTSAAAAALPLLAGAALLTIVAENFVTYFFGWSAIGALGFMAVAFSTPAKDERAGASVRYFVLSAFSNALFVAGLLGIYSAQGSLAFVDINARAATAPAWPILCLIAGSMLRTLQIPLMQVARYLSSAGFAAAPVFILGHCLIAGTLIAKLYPSIIALDEAKYFAAVPAVTALVAGIFAVIEQEPARVIGWISSYVCAAVFLSGLAGDYQAAQASALTGALGVLVLSTCLSEFAPSDRGARWLLAFGAAIFAGLPFMGWGWARYLEYVGLLRGDGALQGVFAGLKILADAVIALAVWSQVREAWFSRPGSDVKTRWEIMAPISLAAIASFAVVVGGRPLGGLLGNELFELFPGGVWFERLVLPPAGAARALKAARDAAGTDADIWSRILTIAVFVLPALVAAAWLFRERKAFEEFRAATRRLSKRLRYPTGIESLLWDSVLIRAASGAGRVAAAFDSRVVDAVFGALWATPARLFTRAFDFVERTVLDRSLVDSLAAGVVSLGKSLRLVQNGQVQFYFALGLIIMGAIVVRFLLAGG